MDKSEQPPSSHFFSGGLAGLDFDTFRDPAGFIWCPLTSFFHRIYRHRFCALFSWTIRIDLSFDLYALVVADPVVQRTCETFKIDDLHVGVTCFTCSDTCSFRLSSCLHLDPTF